MQITLLKHSERNNLKKKLKSQEIKIQFSN